MTRTKPIFDEIDAFVNCDPPSLYVRRTAERVRNHKPTLASVAKQAAKAGIEVARYEFEANGKIIIITGRSVTPDMTRGTDTETSADLRKLL